MKLPQLKQLSRTTWFIAITLVILAVVWTIVIFPAVGRLQRTAQTILDSQSTQASSTQATANLIAALQQRTTLEDHAKRMETFFVARNNPLAFVSRLEELAADHNVTLDLVLSEPEAAVAGTLTPTNVTVNVDGELDQTLEFMNALLTDEVFLDVQAVKIVAISDTPGIVTLSLETISYWH